VRKTRPRANASGSLRSSQRGLISWAPTFTTGSRWSLGLNHGRIGSGRSPRTASAQGHASHPTHREG
jgi:hypothetical protein